MRCSVSSNSPKAESKPAERPASFLHRPAVVWLLRILVGGVFVVSGWAKLVDVWGTVIKVEEYVDVWNWAVPRTVIMVGALSLSAFEFTAGLLLLSGCYRRVVTWLLATCMAFMLPLTAWIWIADPVSDCGCFGDFVVLSNAATFWKNVVLTVLIIILVVNNRCAGCFFRPPSQWAVAVSALFYSLTVALVGYNVQPLVDFRPFPPGAPLVADSGDDGTGMVFIYEKNGIQSEFDIDNLPDEADGWIYVDRMEPAVDDNRLAVFDPETDEDVTDQYLAGADSLMLLVISEPLRADLSHTYTINELSDAVERDGGNFAALLATGREGVELWRDNSMASYPCLAADDTQLKQLARGVMSLVWITNDTVRWKRTVASVGLDRVESIASGSQTVDSLNFDGAEYMVTFTLVLICVLAVLWLLQAIVVSLQPSGRRSDGDKEIANVKKVD